MKPIAIMRLRNQSIAGGGGVSYATLNPADIAADLTLSGGNLAVTRNGTNNLAWRSVRANQGKSSGKWYYEIKNTANSVTAGRHMLGTMAGGSSLTNRHPGLDGESTGVQDVSPDWRCFQAGVSALSTGYGTLALNDWLFIALDLNAGKIWCKRSSSANWDGGGDPAAGTAPTRTFTPGGTLYPAIGLYDSPAAAEANFGASAFVGTVPSGFNAGWYV